MNFDFDLGQWIVIGLSAFLFIWYFTANSLNRRRGIAIYRWLYRSLGEIGKISVAEWIGSSNMGARLVVKKAVKPFRHVEARYLLEPREFLPYWLFSRLRGKRDEVVIQVTLRTAPKADLEITNWEKRHLAKKSLASNQVPQDSQIAYNEPEEVYVRTVVEKFLTEHGSTVEKIIVQREAPHLTIHTKIKALLRSPAESYFRTLLTLFQDS
jgi:hypothetical protein